jgi:hypothetical protein
VSKEIPRGQGKHRGPEWWPESSGRGADDDFLIEAFSCQVWSLSVLLGRLQVTSGGRAASWEVPGALGKPTAPEWWPESSGRSLDDNVQVEAFFCQVWLFCVLPKVLEAQDQTLEGQGWRLEAQS